jgi:chromosome segregation ATPase
MPAKKKAIRFDIDAVEAQFFDALDNMIDEIECAAEDIDTEVEKLKKSHTTAQAKFKKAEDRVKDAKTPAAKDKAKKASISAKADVDAIRMQLDEVEEDRKVIEDADMKLAAMLKVITEFEEDYAKKVEKMRKEENARLEKVRAEKAKAEKAKAEKEKAKIEAKAKKEKEKKAAKGKSEKADKPKTKTVKAADKKKISKTKSKSTPIKIESEERTELDILDMPEPTAVGFAEEFSHDFYDEDEYQNDDSVLVVAE